MPAPNPEMLSSAHSTLLVTLGPYFGDATKIWCHFIFLIEIEKQKIKAPDLRGWWKHPKHLPARGFLCNQQITVASEETQPSPPPEVCTFAVTLPLLPFQ